MNGKNSEAYFTHEPIEFSILCVLHTYMYQMRIQKWVAVPLGRNQELGFGNEMIKFCLKLIV
jgi:hypothetical protein